MGNACRDVFFSKNVSDPVLESFGNVQDLIRYDHSVLAFEVFVGGFVCSILFSG